MGSGKIQEIIATPRTGVPATLIFLTFTLTASLLTYPLPFHLLTHIPQGSEGVGTVPLLNLWTLQWNIKQLILGYPNYWDAPIFTPQPGTFAFSESQPLSGLLAAPLWLSSGSPALAYNAVVVLFLGLNGWFAYWLMRHWAVSRGPALITGLLVQALPFVAQELGVLQLIAIFGVLWSLLFLGLFFRASQVSHQRWRRIVGLVLGTPVTFFTCGYYGLFSLFFLPLAFLTYRPWPRLSRRGWSQLGVAALLIVALTGPPLLSQQQRLTQLGFKRNAETIQFNSGELRHYTNFLDYNLLYGQLLGVEPGAGQRLFPGVGLLLLAGLGLVTMRQAYLRIYLLAAMVLALMLSLGLRLSIFGVQPYQWVRDVIPGFAQLRSPFRFAVFVQLHLALLAGFGLNAVWHRLPRGRDALFVGLASLTLFEMLALPLPLQPVPVVEQPAEWQAWLNQQPASPQIVILPFAAENGVAHFEQTTRWMLANYNLEGAMLNGYSGFFPPGYGRIQEQMVAFPNEAAIQTLQAHSIDFVVVHEQLPDAPLPQEMGAWLKPVFRDDHDDVSIYEVREPE
ncbi:MAG: sulfite exporter TauE/SafE family protein [Anaerolineae bacterium]|nr:sulfite exporter TauE/SafE family protein [Anaerolineae bacterium]